MNAQHAQLELRRAYFLFVHTIASSQLDDVLRSDRNLPSLSNVLTTVAQAACGIDDRRVQRQCFLIFVQLTKLWLPEKRQADPVPGFADFMSTHAIAACFDAPRLEGFDPQDGQVRGCGGPLQSQKEENEGEISSPFFFPFGSVCTH